MSTESSHKQITYSYPLCRYLSLALSVLFLEVKHLLEWLIQSRKQQKDALESAYLASAAQREPTTLKTSVHPSALGQRTFLENCDPICLENALSHTQTK